MSKIVLKADNIGKQYRLGEVGTGTISHDLNRWFARIRGKEDPFSKIGQENDRTKKAESDFVWALQNINFEVEQGDVLGIIGKNGAGKSTLLKLISRITAPTTGSIKVKGRIASLLEVGTGMHPEMTARENIYLNGAIMGMTKKEISRKFDEIIDFAGCNLYVDTPVKRFSSGMRVRLGFAVAAFLEPEILIVDEVLAVGDAEFQKKAIGKMKDVSQGEGRTVLFVSHNMESIRALCTKGLLLKNGMVHFSGTADETVDFYKKGINNEIRNQDKLFTQGDLGNDKIQIHNVFARAAQSQLINIETGVEIVCDCSLKVDNVKLTFGIKVASLEGILMFETGFYLDESETNTEKGKYRLISKIPANILNAGVYEVMVIFGHNMRDLLYSKTNILTFEVENTAYNGSIYRKLPGVIRPDIAFKAEKI